jgi:hypothetical protein
MLAVLTSGDVAAGPAARKRSGGKTRAKKPEISSPQELEQALDDLVAESNRQHKQKS